MMSDQEPKELKTVYEEICRSHTGVVDFRSKLLAFLPIASGVGILVLVTKVPVDVQPSPLFLPAGVFGALTTLGLFIYELRGIQTCHALLESARKLERELLGSVGDFGPFTLKPPDLWGVIGTAGAALLIYPTVMGAWVFTAGLGLLNSLDESGISSVLKGATGFTLGLMLLGLVVHLRQEESLQAEVKIRERKSEEQALAANS